MAEVRGMRKTRTGVVVSDKMDKTIVVEIRTRIALIAAIAFITTAIRPISPAEIAGIMMFQPPSVSVPAVNISTRSAAPL
mgnify:CR=1 FL=1